MENKLLTYDEILKQADDLEKTNFIYDYKNVKI